MQIKEVKAASVEEKSAAQKEEELLKKQEEEKAKAEEAAKKAEEEAAAASASAEEDSLKDEDVLSYFKNKYGREAQSIDELLKPKEVPVDIPEDVSKYMEFKKNTNRGFEDFLKFQEDFESKSEDDRLRQFLLATEEGLDKEDIDIVMEEYSFDEDLDDEADVRKIKLKKKKAIAKAKDWFNQNKEQYGVKLESSGASVPESEKEQYEAYKQYLEEAKTLEEENQRKRDYFLQKTDEVFGEEFKGFEFQVAEDKTLSFVPGKADELKEAHQNPMSFIGKYLDEKGLLKDSTGYHKALAVAMNPEKFAKFFYEQGISDAVVEDSKNIKNIDMGVRQPMPPTQSSGGFKVKAVSSESGRGFKIKDTSKKT